MKSWFLICLLIICISVACSSAKSSGSSATTANASITQPSLTAINAKTQEKPSCDLTMSQSPVINGLRLRMTADEVLAVFPGSKIDEALRTELSQPPSKFGTSSFVVKPSKYEGQEKFVEISQISFTLLDNRVSNFTLSYRGPEWPHVDKFVEKFVAGSNLPAPDQWEAYVGMDNQMKTLKCVDFEVRVFAGGQGGSQNYVLLRDLEADKELKNRRAKAKEKPTPG